MGGVVARGLALCGVFILCETGGEALVETCLSESGLVGAGSSGVADCAAGPAASPGHDHVKEENEKTISESSLAVRHM